MKNKQTLQSVPQPETTKQSAKPKVSTRSNRGAPASPPQQSSKTSSKRALKEYDQIEETIEVAHGSSKEQEKSSKNSSQQQHLTKSSHNSFQSPQLLADENKESAGECYSTSTKMRRELRNTTDSKSLSSTKTTPLIVSPSKIGPNNKRVHLHHSSHIQHSEEEMEEPCLKKKIQQSFMANSQKIEELDNELIKNEDKCDAEMHMEEEFGQYEHAHQSQLQQQQVMKSKGTFNYRQPKQRDTSSKKKNQVDTHDLVDSHQEEIEPHEDPHEDHQSLPSEQLHEQHNQPHSERVNQGTGLPEQDTEPRQSRIRIQKINFGGFSDSDDLTGPDSNSQNNNGNFKGSSKKAVGKSVTLIFSRKPGQNNNHLENSSSNNLHHSANHSMSLREEIEGQQQSIQAGNLFISICNTDEHYPPLFNQKYLEDNISLIQKRQCHMRQKRRMLQLDSINSISIDKDNRLYNLLDERVIKEQSQGSIQVLNGIVEYEQSLRPQPVTKQKVKCNCKKTKCLKLYCDCFNQGVLCSPDCNCSECFNTADRKDERENAIALLKGRNPDAFKPKIQTKEDDEEVLVHNKGCNCKKSGCEKKYCECYNTGVKCSDQCKCDGCRNRDPSHLIKNNSHNNSGVNNPGGSISSSNNPFLWNNQVKSTNMNASNNNNEHDYEYMFQSSLALGSNHHHLNQSLNNQRNNGSSSSPEDSLATFRQSSKKFNMGEYNADIPRQLTPGDSQQGYQKNKFLGLSSFAFSQDEENNLNNCNINNSYVSSHNNQGHFFGGSNNSKGMRSKDEFFGEEGDKGNQTFRDQDNATVVSLQNGQISVIKQEEQ